MATVRGCVFPDHLLYDVSHHTWYSPVDETLLRFGVSEVGLLLAREVLVFTPKRVGHEFEKDRSLATLESAKWVGSVRSAFDGTVIAINEALVRRPTIANDDCYGEGWMMLVQPARTDWRDSLVTGEAIEPAYEVWMENAAFAGRGMF
jgi:glycine cleavage system H protein